VSRKATIITLLVPLAALAGCGGSPEQADAPQRAAATATPTTAAAAASTPLEGVWEKDLKLPKGNPGTPGPFELEISGDELRTYILVPPARSWDWGSPIEVDGNRLVVQPDTKCPDQPRAEKGVYEFAVEGDRLSLELVRDSCRDRVDVFTRGAWTRQ
jgi:hypothetical protein